MRRVKYGGMNVAEEKKMNEEAVEETPTPEEELVPEETAEEAAPEANPWEEKYRWLRKNPFNQFNPLLKNIV